MPDLPASLRADESDRRTHILASAARVIADHGVRAFTFRAVADAAGVPLGSTTYYFKDRDELLVETLRHARDASRDANETLMHGLITQFGLAEGIAALIEQVTGANAEQLTRNYRIYVLALYQPSLQPEVASWHPEHDLGRYVDADIAVMLGRLIEGYLIHAVINQIACSAESVLPAIKRILAS